MEEIQTEEERKSFAAPLIFILVFLFHFVSKYMESQKNKVFFFLIFSEYCYFFAFQIREVIEWFMAFVYIALELEMKFLVIFHNFSIFRDFLCWYRKDRVRTWMLNCVKRLNSFWRKPVLYRSKFGWYICLCIISIIITSFCFWMWFWLIFFLLMVNVF